MDSKISPLLGAGRVPETVGIVHVGPFQSCAPWAHSALLDGMLACHCEYSVLEFRNEVIFFTGSEEFKGVPGQNPGIAEPVAMWLSPEHDKGGKMLSPEHYKGGKMLSPEHDKGGRSHTKDRVKGRARRNSKSGLMED